MTIYISIQTQRTYNFDQLALREDQTDDSPFWEGSLIDNDANHTYVAWRENCRIAEKYGFREVFYAGADFKGYDGIFSYSEYVTRQRVLKVFGIEFENVKNLSVVERVALYKKSKVEVLGRMVETTHVEITSPSGKAENISDYAYTFLHGTEIALGQRNRSNVVATSTTEFFVVDAEAYKFLKGLTLR